MSDPSSSAPEVRAAARAARSALERVTNRRGRVGVLGSLNADLTVTTRTLPGPGETVVGDPLVVRPGVVPTICGALVKTTAPIFS